MISQSSQRIITEESGDDCPNEKGVQVKARGVDVGVQVHEGEDPHFNIRINLNKLSAKILPV